MDTHWAHAVAWHAGPGRSGPCSCLARRVGVVAPGAWADLLVVDGNPLVDLEVLTDPARNLRLVMAAGRIHRNDL